MRALLVCVVFVACHSQARPKPPTVEQIIERMIATYRNARTYSDHGFEQEGDNILSTKKSAFRTRFVRDSNFRLEVETGRRTENIVWWTNRTRSVVVWDHREYRDIPITDRLESLGYTTAGLLLRHDHLALRQLRLQGVEAVQQHPCWRLGHDSLTLWIDQRTYLIRHSRFGNRSVTFEPVVDTPVAAELVKEPVARPPGWIGVRIDKETARVTQSVIGSPGHRAGLRLGDSIESINYSPAKEFPPTFELSVTSAKPGETVRIGVDGKWPPMKVPVESQPPASASPLVGRTAPAFTASRVTGSGSTRLADLSGKVVLVVFWATWCTECEAILQRLDALHDQHHARGLRVISLAVETPAEIHTSAQIQSFVADRALRHDVGLDTGDIVASYLVDTLPTVVVIDKQGVVRRVVTEGDLKLVETELPALLK